MKKTYFTAVSVLLMLTLLAITGCSADTPPQPDFWAAEASVLDRDGTDGYSGQYVLIYNPASNPGKISIGPAEGIQKGAESFSTANAACGLPVNASLYTEPDPFVTEELRAAQEKGERSTAKIFKIQEMPSGEMAFCITAEGERCCVWSPLNPAYGPLESIDAAYPAMLAASVDEAIARLEESYGTTYETVHVLCHDLNMPEEYGYTSCWDLYDRCYTGMNGEHVETVSGNGLPMIHVNTAPLLAEAGSFLTLRDAAVHELSHLMLLEKLFPEGYLEGFVTNGDHQSFYMENIHSIELLGELLSMAAQETVYPGSALEHVLPWWYAKGAVWSDLSENDAEYYLRNGGSVLQSGGTLLRGISTREDKAALLLLAHFAHNRCGAEIFPRILTAWQEMGCTGDAVQAVLTAMGYSDRQTFFEEFLLAVLLRDSNFAEGKYRLEAFGGREGTDPFALLRPIVTETQTSIQPGGYIVIRPEGGTYTPADTAEGLVFIGITP